MSDFYESLHSWPLLEPVLTFIIPQGTPVGRALLPQSSWTSSWDWDSLDQSWEGFRGFLAESGLGRGSEPGAGVSGALFASQNACPFVWASDQISTWLSARTRSWSWIPGPVAVNRCLVLVSLSPQMTAMLRGMNLTDLELPHPCPPERNCQHSARSSSQELLSFIGPLGKPQAWDLLTFLPLSPMMACLCFPSLSPWKPCKWAPPSPPNSRLFSLAPSLRTGFLQASWVVSCGFR